MHIKSTFIKTKKPNRLHSESVERALSRKDEKKAQKMARKMARKGNQKQAEFFQNF